MTPTPLHHCRVLVSPWPGVYATHIDSARHYGRHWHSTYGIGLLEHGAQRSASGRGSVDAYAGDLISTNPGEVHDGRPLGGPARRWRIVYLEPAVIASMSASAADVELTRPVIRDARLRRALARLLTRLEGWSASRGSAERLACEESLAHTCALLLERHASTPARIDEHDTAADMRPVRDRLADELLDPPTLAELARMTGCSRYQLLRRFEKRYGVPPHAWLVQQRAERARHSISGGATLAAAAAASGFADQSHMTRVFVRRFGFTPGAWQRAQ